jgi:hypothetical protein
VPILVIGGKVYRINPPKKSEQAGSISRKVPIRAPVKMKTRSQFYEDFPSEIVFDKPNAVKMQFKVENLIK